MRSAAPGPARTEAARAELCWWLTRAVFGRDRHIVWPRRLRGNMRPPPPWLLCLGECAIGQIPPVRTWPKPALIRRRRYRRARLRHEAVCLLAQARTKNLLEGLFRRPFAWRAVAVEPQIRYSVDRLHLPMPTDANPFTFSRGRYREQRWQRGRAVSGW